MALRSGRCGIQLAAALSLLALLGCIGNNASHRVMDEILEERAQHPTEGDRREMASALVRAGAQTGVETLLLLSLMEEESHYKSRATSRRGALGLMQVRPVTGREVARRLLHYLLLAIGLGIALQTIGINLSALFAAGAVFAIGLGFAMQNIMQNFVPGVILLTERSIEPGDVLQVEQRFVRVQKMGIRATIARTLDEEEMIIPNAAIVQANVTDYTLRDSMYRLRCTVGVVHSSDMKLVHEVLEKAARSVAWGIPDKEPVMLPIRSGVRRAKSELNQAIWWSLKEAGITIAFPQLDVHFDEPVAEAMRRAS